MLLRVCALRPRLRLLLCAAVALCAVENRLVSSASAQEFGTITGQFLLEGDLPEPKVQVAKGDSKIKDAAVCAAETLYSNDLIVDEKTRGIANIFVYVYYRDAAKLPVHPDNKESKEKEVVFDQKNCRFIPHAMVVRTDQTVVVKSDDNIAHNTHTNTIRNAQINYLIAPKDREGIPVQKKIAESLPLPVTCDIHPWMKAYWLIVDHPFAAVTAEDGTFTIENLPVGEHELRVWHEIPGYLERSYKVTVKPGKTTLEPVKVPVSKFQQ